MDDGWNAENTDVVKNIDELAKKMVGEIGLDLFDLGELDGEIKFDGCTSSATSDDPEGLTFDKLLEIKLALKKPDLYYATNPFIEKGIVFSVEEMEFTPKYFVCHPDDFGAVEDSLKAMFTLIPLKDCALTEKQLDALIERLGDSLSKMADKSRAETMAKLEEGVMGQFRWRPR